MRKKMKFNRHSSQVFSFYIFRTVLVDGPFISRRFITSIPRTLARTISLNFLSIDSQHVKRNANVLHIEENVSAETPYGNL